MTATSRSRSRPRRRDELGALVGNYNAVGDVLRRERQDLFQRELLLDTVIQSTPLALVLANAAGHVIYSNTVARQMFGHGAKLEGLVFETLVNETPASLQEAVRGGQDTLFSLEGADGEQEVLHLSQRRFVLNGRDHRLYLFKRLTRELTRQEVATWKKVIRVISHELNNSLAPISSLAHSGRRIAQDPDPARLDSIFATIEERARAPEGVPRRLRAIRQAARAPAAGRALGAVRRVLAADGGLQRPRDRPGAQRLVRSGPGAAGADQLAQERARIRLGARRTSSSRSWTTAA